MIDKDLYEVVRKREKEEWEHCQKMYEKYGSDDKLSQLALSRWGQWNEMKNILEEKTNK